MRNNILLKVNGLTKSYGDRVVLENIDTEIRKGEVVAIIGPSGCGKSTFLRSLNQMEEISSGSILFDNVEITSSGVDINNIRRKIGMVFQQFNLFPHMTVRENIMFAPVKLKIMSKAEAKKKADELLERVGLSDKADMYPDMLSGGQKQRIAIARTLAMNPEVILFDEPTSALDPISTSRIEDLAIELKKEYTIVMVTHNMQQATRISDKTAFFLLGELIEYGDTEQLFSMPKQKKTEDYITGRFG